MKFKVIQVGKSGFPVVPAAPIERIRLYGKGIASQGEPVLVINRKGVLTPAQKEEAVVPKGTYDGVYYHFASGSVFRPGGFIKRNLKKLQGLFQELKMLRSVRKSKETGFLIVHSMGFGNMLLYRLIASLWNYKFVYQIVEWNSALSGRSKLKTRISDALFEKIGLRWADGFMPISHYLADLLKERYPNKPQLYVPIICDFTKFEGISAETEDDYLLYCGSLAYAEVVHFILEAYARTNAGDTLLYLVLSGQKEKIEKIKQKAQELGIGDKIKIFSRIPYQELVEKYCGAKALLIPLRPTLQDTARFPHKIGEYLASGNPLITTYYGEIKHHFRHEETAFIADKYEVEAYSRQIQNVLDQPQLAMEVGRKGKAYGLANFDCVGHGNRILQFFQEMDNDSFQHITPNPTFIDKPELARNQA